MGAADPKGDTMTTDLDLPDDEPEHTQSPTAHLLQEMALYGYRPFSDEPDPRPLPEGRQVTGAMADIFDAMAASLTDTRLEPDLEDLLWAMVNVFQRAGERVERELDGNESAQKRLQREQDGSEVKSVELERLLAEGATLIERRDAMEFFRDAAAEQFRIHARKAWTPRSGSKVNRRALTSAVVDSKAFINARRWADNQVLVPPGTRIAFAGGLDFNDYGAIYAVLDKVRAKHPDMVLLHCGGRTGANLIAGTWANNNKVPQIAFEPDYVRHSRKSAPFKRNDDLLAAMPIGVVLFPGGGIQDNLADKAKAMGIALMDYRKRGGA